MDIIISANEKILTITKENKLTENMTEEEFTWWLNKIAKAGIADESEVQEIPV